MSPLDKSTRREFMAITSSAALGAAVPLTGAQPDALVSNPPSDLISEEIPYSSEELFDSGPQRTFSADNATQVAMPLGGICLLYTSPSPRDRTRSRMPSSA